MFSNSGKDSGAGSSGSPWKSIQYAVNRSEVGAGDRVIVKDGNYRPFHVTRSGSNGANLVVMSENVLGATIEGNEQYDGRYAGIHVVGNYVTIQGFNVACSGSPAANPGERGIRVSGFPDDFNEGVQIKNNKVTGAGWVGITTSYANDPLIAYNDVSGSVVQHGIYVANSGDRPVVRGNIIYNNNQAGLHMNGDLPSSNPEGVDGIISNAIVENNIIHTNSGGASSSAINLDGVDHSQIRNNLLFNNFSQGISNFRIDGGGPSSYNRIVNNTIVMADGAYHALKFRDGSDNGYVRNNILLQQGTGDALAVCSDCVDGLDSDFNIIAHLTDPGSEVEDYGTLANWQGSTGRDLNSLTLSGSSASAILSDLFQNPTVNINTANYAPKNGGSAIDRGTDITDAPTDINGTSRPQGSATDIGAYEGGADNAMTVPQNVNVSKN